MTGVTVKLRIDIFGVKTGHHLKCSEKTLHTNYPIPRSIIPYVAEMPKRMSARLYYSLHLERLRGIECTCPTYIGFPAKLAPNTG